MHVSPWIPLLQLVVVMLLLMWLSDKLLQWNERPRNSYALSVYEARVV